MTQDDQSIIDLTDCPKAESLSFLLSTSYKVNKKDDRAVKQSAEWKQTHVDTD